MATRVLTSVYLVSKPPYRASWKNSVYEGCVLEERELPPADYSSTWYSTKVVETTFDDREPIWLKTEGSVCTVNDGDYFSSRLPINEAAKVCLAAQREADYREYMEWCRKEFPNLYQSSMERGGE